MKKTNNLKQGIIAIEDRLLKNVPFREYKKWSSNLFVKYSLVFMTYRSFTNFCITVLSSEWLNLSSSSLNFSDFFSHGAKRSKFSLTCQILATKIQTWDKGRVFRGPRDKIFGPFLTILRSIFIFCVRNHWKQVTGGVTIYVTNNW